MGLLSATGDKRSGHKSAKQLLAVDSAGGGGKSMSPPPFDPGASSGGDSGGGGGAMLHQDTKHNENHDKNPLDHTIGEKFDSEDEKEKKDGKL